MYLGCSSYIQGISSKRESVWLIRQGKGHEVSPSKRGIQGLYIKEGCKVNLRDVWLIL